MLNSAADETTTKYRQSPSVSCFSAQKTSNVRKHIELESAEYSLEIQVQTHLMRTKLNVLIKFLPPKDGFLSDSVSSQLYPTVDSNYSNTKGSDIKNTPVIKISFYVWAPGNLCSLRRYVCENVGTYK